MAFMQSREAEPIRYAQQRKHRRFDLQFPVCVNFPSHGEIHQFKGLTKNVSVGGMLLKAASQLPLRTQVRLTIEVNTPWSGRHIQLHAEGEIVRVEELEKAQGFALAVECKRPIEQIGEHLRIAS